MSIELQPYADVSAQLDRLLYHYLHIHPLALDPAVCPSWLEGEAIPREPLRPESSRLKYPLSANLGVPV